MHSSIPVRGRLDVPSPSGDPARGDCIFARGNQVISLHIRCVVSKLARKSRGNGGAVAVRGPCVAYCARVPLHAVDTKSHRLRQGGGALCNYAIGGGRLNFSALPRICPRPPTAAPEVHWLQCRCHFRPVAQDWLSRGSYTTSALGPLLISAARKSTDEAP